MKKGSKLKRGQRFKFTTDLATGGVKAFYCTACSVENVPINKKA